MEDYLIERVNSSHYSLLSNLYVNAFALNFSEKDIAERFNTNLLGCEHIGFIAIDTKSGIAAAYYGVFPVQIKTGDNVLLVAQSGDTMTHSDHRMKGLFVKLATLTYEVCKTKNIQFVFGQPNKDSRAGLLKMGWTDFDILIRKDVKLSLKTIPTPKLALRNRFFKKLYLAYTRFIFGKKITTTIESFDNTIQSEYFKVNRGNHYLEYKKSPDKFFLKVDDVILWVKLSDVFWIGDFSDYSKVTPLTITKLKRLAFWLGYNTISFNINKSISLPETFSCFKEYSSEHSMLLLLNPDLKINNILLTAADFDTW